MSKLLRGVDRMKKNIEKFVKENFNKVVEVFDKLGYMVVRRTKNNVQGILSCKYCQANLEFARTHNLDVLQRIDTFDIVGVCIDKKVSENER